MSRLRQKLGLALHEIQVIPNIINTEPDQWLNLAHESINVRVWLLAGKSGTYGTASPVGHVLTLRPSIATECGALSFRRDSRGLFPLHR